MKYNPDLDRRQFITAVGKTTAFKRPAQCAAFSARLNNGF